MFGDPWAQLRSIGGWAGKYEGGEELVLQGLHGLHQSHQKQGVQGSWTSRIKRMHLHVEGGR